MRFLVFVLILIEIMESLKNGLILTPPMGWLSWERFRCNIDCKNYPEDCISEKLFQTMADHLNNDGYKEAGYKYVIMDDCWLAEKRDNDGRLQSDSLRFPSGIKALADYVHKHGLLLGIYEDIGLMTCKGYPGSEFYLQLDAQTFADWMIDYLKLDGCYFNSDQYKFGYPPVAFFLNKTGRPIALSCEYALHQIVESKQPNYTAQAEACNLGRNFNDIDDSWESLKSVVEFFGKDEGKFSNLVSPGYFNDPDMLMIGNFGLSFNQEQVQMAIWCILPAPLLMSNDLRNIRQESKELLLNKKAIAINQDPLAVSAKYIAKEGTVQIWTRPILPSGSYAFALINIGTAVPSKILFHLKPKLTKDFHLNFKVKSNNGPFKIFNRVKEYKNLNKFKSENKNKLYSNKNIINYKYNLKGEIFFNSNDSYINETIDDWIHTNVNDPNKHQNVYTPSWYNIWRTNNLIVGYNITDIFSNVMLGTFDPKALISITVNPTGAFLGTAIAVYKK